MRRLGLLRPCGLRSFNILIGLRRPWFRFKDAPKLLLRRWDDRSVPCRDSAGLFCELIELRCSRRAEALPGDLGICCWICCCKLLTGLLRSSVLKFHGDGEPWGLRSDGLRLVRKLWDLALRIFGRDFEWWDLDDSGFGEKGPFSLC